MKRRRIIVFAVGVALAFGGSAGPRHAQAATQNHDHAAAAQHHQDSHDHAGGLHSHDHDMAAESHAVTGSTHDHAGSAPVSDQGCCFAWCNSVAIMHAADWLFTEASHDKPFASERPFRIAAFASAIDPPPR